METMINNSMCRCCASEGTFKDVHSSYHWMGEEEVYSDMLRDCFDISLCTNMDGDDGGICEVCITQLRNAANFKKQVLSTEEQFKRRLQDKLFKDNIVKVEVQRDDDSEDNQDISEDYSGTEYEVPIKTEEDEKPRKRAAKASTSRAKKSKTDGETSKRTGDTKRRKKKKGDESATPERVEHRVNLATILKYSNASPFRDKTMRGFSCLYCAKYFATIQELREHTARQEEKDKINSMIDYKLSYNPIKVDITDLQCNLCEFPMQDLSDLKEHLVSVHNRVIHKDIKDIILPFRLQDGHNFTCVVCSMQHISFKNLYHHMSSHYRNYCCNKCGAGYITIAALRKHGKTHFQGHFPCAYCEKSYSSLAKKRNHEKGVHTGGWLRNKCPYCPEIFVSYYDRSEHLVKAHNETPILYPCNACSKTYKKKFELNRHIKHHHLQQRSYLCDKCNAKFFSKRGLTDHLTRHAGGEVCSCDVCGKSFTRYRSLKEHMKVHEDDKRYQCEICKKTFMQKCSLKSHVRLHQDDLEIFKEFDDVKHLIDNREMTLKQIAQESKKKEHDEKMKGGETRARKRQKRVQESDYKQTYELVYHEKELPETKKQWHNLSTLLKYSNATPFKDRNDAGYICAYCYKSYPDPDILRSHTKTDHDKEKLTYKAGSGMSNFVAMLDIVDLKCTICNSPKDSLQTLMEHLVASHDKQFYLGVTDYLQPYKLTNEQQINCCLCDAVFHNMKLLMQHMNGHYRNFICTICGAGFVNSFRLSRHETTHAKKKSGYACPHCGLVFAVESKKKNHVNTEHKGIVGHCVCQICKERFKNYYQKSRHMSAVHHVEGIKCDMCDKRFNLKSQMMLHIRSVHLKERPYECSVCSMGFFVKSHMTGHYIATHTNERKFKCDVCGKAYATQNSKRKHMKKSHGITKSRMLSNIPK